MLICFVPTYRVVYTLDSLDGEAKVFLDPNKLSDDGTTAVSSKKWSKDGSICAVSLSHSGSDWVEIKVSCPVSSISNPPKQGSDRERI